MVAVSPLSRRLADLTSPEIDRHARAGAVLVVPVGSCEQHGPHLPVTTDAEIATALCEALAVRRPDVLLAPTVPYGSCGEHDGFAGTLSIGQQATELLLVELGRSATQTFSRVLMVSGHGGNAEPVGRAIALLRSEGRDVRAWSPRLEVAGQPPVDAHAGRTETAIMTHLRPAVVQAELAEAGDTRPIAELMPALRAGGVRSVSPNGVLGDPAGATAAEGAQRFGAALDALEAFVAAWPPDRQEQHDQ